MNLSAPLPTSGDGDVVISVHAAEQMLSRDVRPDEVGVILSRPEQTYVSNERGSARRVYQGGDLAVVVDSGRGEVVTVLYRRPDQWSSADGRPSGRRLSRRTRQKMAAELRRMQSIARPA